MLHRGTMCCWCTEWPLSACTAAACSLYAQLIVGVDAGSTVPPGHPLSLLYGGGSDTSSANQLAVREAASKPLGPPQELNAAGTGSKLTSAIR